MTADFVYVRLHGSTQLYVSGYSDAELDVWARRVVAWSSGTRGSPPRDVYVYFDNDAKVHAPHDARRLRERIAALGIPAARSARGTASPALAVR